MELNESIIKQLIEVLEAGLPAEIVSRNLAITDGFTLDPPVQILDYMPVPATYGGGLPIVAIQDLPGRFSNDLQHSMESTFGFGIASLIQTADHRTLTWQLRRYNEAVASVIQADRLAVTPIMAKAPALVEYVSFAGTEPGPLLGNHNPESEGSPPDSFRSWTWLLIECRRQEVGGG